MKKTLLIITLVCATLMAKAQEEDRVKYDFNYGKTAASKGGGQFLDNKISLTVPLNNDKKNQFTIGGEIARLDISGTGSIADVSTLTTVGVKFGYRTFLGQSTLFTLSAEPLIASDFGSLDGSVRFKSEALALFNTTHKFAFGFGIGYQYQFSGSQILPLATTLWKISDHVTLSGLLPIAPRLEIKVNPKWSVGGGVNGDYASYRLNDFNNQYIQYQNWSFGGTAKYKPIPHLQLGAFLGVGVRRLDIYDSNQTIPLRIYSWDIGGGSHVPSFEKKYSGLALNFSVAYKFE